MDKSGDNLINNLKILIVEDDLASEKYITIVVKIFSKEILVVRNGVEAVKTCHDNLDLDLILMDIELPKMDGYEATRQIREFNKDVTIIAQTAYALKGDREKAIEAGCNDYISKPIDRTLLKELIKMHFNE
jgi:CheY-like chemotaxis protein